MQAIYMNENEESTSGGTNPVGIVIYIERSSRYLEEEYIGRPGRRTIGI